MDILVCAALKTRDLFWSFSLHVFLMRLRVETELTSLRLLFHFHQYFLLFKFQWYNKTDKLEIRPQECRGFPLSSFWRVWHYISNICLLKFSLPHNWFALKICLCPASKIYYKCFCIIMSASWRIEWSTCNCKETLGRGTCKNRASV